MAGRIRRYSYGVMSRFRVAHDDDRRRYDGSSRPPAVVTGGVVAGRRPVRRRAAAPPRRPGRCARRPVRSADSSARVPPTLQRRWPGASRRAGQPPHRLHARHRFARECQHGRGRIGRDDAVTGGHQMPGQCAGPAAELQYHPATLAHRPQFGQDPRRTGVTVATEPW